MSQPNANPNVVTQKTADLIKRCTCAEKFSSTLQHQTFPHVSSLLHTNLTRHVSIRTLSKSFPQRQRLSALPRTAAVGCERLTTAANAQATRREQGSTPRPPELNENPSLLIREEIIQEGGGVRVRKNKGRRELDSLLINLLTEYDRISTCCDCLELALQKRKKTRKSNSLSFSSIKMLYIYICIRGFNDVILQGRNEMDTGPSNSN